MSKTIAIFLLAFITLASCARLKTETTCANLLSPCSITVVCCLDYVCRDYRCAKSGTKDNQIEWAPKGNKCDWFNHCKDGFDCRDNRCFNSTSTI